MSKKKNKKDINEKLLEMQIEQVRINTKCIKINTICTVITTITALIVAIIKW